jgi:two-component system OmpR family response regulator
MQITPMAILLIEDEVTLAQYVAGGLQKNGHNVEHVGRGDSGYELARQFPFDLLIVDRMLPGLDGLELVSSLRRIGVKTPVLFLSNLGGLDDRVEGLNAGADDYLGKPFAFTELLARVNALLRRPAPSQSESFILKVGNMELDRLNRRVTRDGQTILLQPREFALLEYLMKAPGQIITRTMLLEQVWNYNFDPKTHIVETHISRLRAKVGSDLIHTVRGAGYVIRAPSTNA